MATLEELQAGLVKADAAGNADDAKAFADAIRQMQPVAAPAAPQTFDAVPLPSPPKPADAFPENSLNDIVGKAAQTGDPVEIEGFMSDVARTSEALWLSANRGVAGTIEGGQRFSLDLLAKISGSEAMKDMANTFASMTAEEHKQFARAFKDEFGESFAFDLANVGGAVAPFLVLPAKGAAGTKVQEMLVKREIGAGKATVIGGGVSGAIGGAVAGPIQFQDAPDLDTRLKNDLNNAMIGTFLGGAAGTVLSSVPAVYNAFKQTLYKTFDESRINRISRAASDIGVTSMRLSDLTGSDVALAMERASTVTKAGKEAIEGTAKETRKQFLSFFGKTISSLQKKNKGSGPLPERLMTAYNSAEDDLMKVRSSNAAKNFAEAENAIVKQWEDFVENLPPGQRVDELSPVAGDPTFISRLKARRVIPGENYVKALDELEQRFASAVPSKETDAAVRHIQTLRERFLTERQGHYSPRELQASLHKYGLDSKARTDSPGRGFSAETKRLIDTKIFGALKQDLNAAAENPQLPGATALRVARDKYRDDSVPLDRLRETGLASLFGVNGKIPPTMEAVRDKVIAMPASQLKQAFTLLKRYDPALSDKIAEDWLTVAFQKAQRPSKQMEEAGRFPFDAAEFLKIGDDKAKFSLIFKGKDRVRINTAIKLLSKIGIQSEKANRPFMPLLAQSARVAYSRDPTFAAGLAVQLFAPNAMARYVRSDKALEALRILSGPFNLEKWAPAVTTLVNVSMSDQLEPPKQAQDMSLMGR